MIPLIFYYLPIKINKVAQSLYVIYLFIILYIKITPKIINSKLNTAIFSDKD